MTESKKTQTTENAETTEKIEISEEEKSEKKDVPWWKNKRAQYGMVAGACALVLIGGGIAIASNQPVPTEEAETAQTSQVEQVTTHQLKVTLDLPEWSEDSTPALLEVNDGVDTTYKAIESSNPFADLTLENGNYTLSLISPINADGSIYIVSDPQNLTFDGTTGANIQTPFTGTKLPAEDVTEEQINAIKDAFNKAKDTGKVDQTTVDKVTNNANAGTDARNSKSDEEKKQAQETAKQETQQKQENSSAGQSSNSSGSGSGNSGNSGNSGQSQQSTPAHQHSWSPVYKTVHHDAVTEEQQQPIYEEVMRCTDCGVINPSREHSKNHALNGDSGGCYSDTIQTGTKTITVTVTPAWDEQVVAGYTCSCGATK